MTTSEHAAATPSRWFGLPDGTLLLVEADPETGAPAWSRWRPGRPLGPDDLRAYDQASAASMEGLRGRLWFAVVAGVVFLLGVLVALAGFVAYQVESTESLGATLFWLGLPVAVLGFVLRVVSRWVLRRGLGRVQAQFGFEPFSAEPLEDQEARALVEGQGTTFVLDRRH